MQFELHPAIGAALWRRQLTKARGHKYIRRIPKPGGGYRYIYRATSGKHGTVGHEGEIKAGAKFRFGNGHYHIDEVTGDGWAKITHDETGQSEWKKTADLTRLLQTHHKAAITTEQAKARATVEAARKFGSRKQIARAEEYARRVGVEVPRSEAEPKPKPAPPVEGAPAHRIGDVVTLDGGRRRYVVTTRHKVGDAETTYNLRALSGGDRGSGPSAVKAARLSMSPSQVVEFTGARKDKRKRDAMQAIATGYMHTGTPQAEHDDALAKVRGELSAAELEQRRENARRQRKPKAEKPAPEKPKPKLEPKAGEAPPAEDAHAPRPAFSEYDGMTREQLLQESKRLKTVRMGGYEENQPRPASWRPLFASDPKAAAEAYARTYDVDRRLGRHPWQMTPARARVIHRIPPSKHAEKVVEALRRGENVPDEVLAAFPAGELGEALVARERSRRRRAAKRAERRPSQEPEGLAEKRARLKAHRALADEAHNLARRVGEAREAGKLPDYPAEGLRTMRNDPARGIVDLANALQGGHGTAAEVRAFGELRDKWEQRLAEVEGDNFEGDIPADRATAAHRHTSWTPERRAEGVRKDYAATLRHFEEQGKKLAGDDPEKQRQAREMLEAFRKRYKEKTLAWLDAKSRTASTMVTGGSGFNTRRNDKANRVADKRGRDLNEYRAGALKRLENTLAPKSVSADRPGAVQVLQSQLDEAQKLQAQMKAANRIVRSKKHDDETKRAKLVDLGMSERGVDALLKPDVFGRVSGFEAYQLQNNNAKIKRLRERIGAISVEQAKPTREHQGDGFRVVDNADANRVQVVFDGKPDAEMRARLKRNGFRWAPSQGAWQRQRTNAAREAVRRELGVDMSKALRPTIGPPPARNRARYPYQGTVEIPGLPRIRIENKRGSYREGVDSDGKAWRTKMPADYGEFERSKGADGDPVDVFVGQDAHAPFVYVVAIKDPSTGEHDEDKVFVCFPNKAAALACFRAAYNRSDLHQETRKLTFPEFARWLADHGHKGVKLEGGSVMAKTMRGLAEKYRGRLSKMLRVNADWEKYEEDQYLQTLPDTAHPEMSMPIVPDEVDAPHPDQLAFDLLSPAAEDPDQIVIDFEKALALDDAPAARGGEVQALADAVDVVGRMYEDRQRRMWEDVGEALEE